MYALVKKSFNNYSVFLGGDPGVSGSYFVRIAAKDYPSLDQLRIATLYQAQRGVQIDATCGEYLRGGRGGGGRQGGGGGGAGFYGGGGGGGGVLFK